MYSYQESIPEPGGSEVLVRIKACGLSDVDVELLQAMGQSRQEIPCGVQIAGIVTKGRTNIPTSTER